jgi:hypothetical protein
MERDGEGSYFYGYGLKKSLVTLYFMFHTGRNLKQLKARSIILGSGAGKQSLYVCW